jgi:hypothetical protein
MSQTYTSNDFNDIMNSLVLFMRNQDEFRDMNFDGSAITELLRVLSFNAQQQAFQNNFVYNELQLDSAQLRQNVTSIASRLGYTPSSATAAKLKVNITVTPSDPTIAPASLVLNGNNQFYSTKDGQTYIFSPDQTYSATLAGGVYLFTGVTLLQGIWTINGFLVQTQYGTESYVIPNGGVDVSTLQVTVRTSETSGDQVTYNQFKTAYDLGPTSNLFFIRENRDSLYEFKFGDGKFANRLNYGNVITARYLVTQGSAGNNIAGLSPVASIGGFYDISIAQVDTRSYGGADQEDIESIRTLAPISFATSGNAVTPGDYVGLAKKLFAETSDAIAWGGEDNVPPKYGYVYLSVIPKNSDILSSDQKASLVSILKQYNVGSVTPIIVDPVYTYINVNTTVKYRANALTISTDALKAKVVNYCQTYSANKMAIFGGVLDMSNLSDFINTIDASISGNYTLVTYEKRFLPNLNVESSYTIPFSHKISPNTINITGFTVADANSSGYTYNLYDDGNGNLKLQKTNLAGTVQMSGTFGTVDYTNGIVNIDSFQPNTLTDFYVTVACSCNPTDDQSMIGVKNSILKFNQINVTPVAVLK